MATLSKHIECSCANIFNPDFFVDISHQINDKIDAVNCYESQIKNNLSRSSEAVKV